MQYLNEDRAYELSHNWFLIDGEDHQIADGVSLGLVLQLIIFEYFFKESNETRDRNGLKGVLKRRHLEWHTRFLHNCLTQRRGDLHHVDLVTIFDVNNRPMIESTNLVVASCVCEQMSVAGIVADRFLFRQATCGIDCFYLTNEYSIIDEFTSRRMAREQIAIFKHFYCAYCLNLSKFRVVNSEAAIFLRFIKKNIQQLCREIVALTKLLVKLEPKAILLSSDAHRIGRIVAQIAKKLGIKTYVIQHGAPIWKYGYVPIVADKMLVWGANAFDWFTSHGVPVEQLEIVGNPRFDQIIEDPPEMNSDRNQKLLLLPNPIGRDFVRSMISSFILAASLHDGSVIIKLHPSETDIDWFKKQIPGYLKAQIQISTKPLSEIGICFGDIAIVANSTAGVDVVLLGGAIVNVEFPGMPNPIPYNKYMIGVNTDINSLSFAIKQVKSFDQKIWCKNRKIFLEKILYRLDGMSAKRAANVILNGGKSELTK